MAKHYFVFNPKSGLTPIFGAVFVIFTAEIIAPGIIEHFCNYGYIKERTICLANVEEPVKTQYNDVYSPPQYVTASGTASTSVSPSPSPAPDFS